MSFNVAKRCLLANVGEYDSVLHKSMQPLLQLLHSSPTQQNQHWAQEAAEGHIMMLHCQWTAGELSCVNNNYTTSTTRPMRIHTTDPTDIMTAFYQDCNTLNLPIKDHPVKEDTNDINNNKDDAKTTSDSKTKTTPEATEEILLVELNLDIPTTSTQLDEEEAVRWKQKKNGLWVWLKERKVIMTEQDARSVVYRPGRGWVLRSNIRKKSVLWRNKVRQQQEDAWEGPSIIFFLHLCLSPQHPTTYAEEEPYLPPYESKGRGFFFTLAVWGVAVVASKNTFLH